MIRSSGAGTRAAGAAAGADADRDAPRRALRFLRAAGRGDLARAADRDAAGGGGEARRGAGGGRSAGREFLRLSARGALLLELVHRFAAGHGHHAVDDRALGDGDAAGHDVGAGCTAVAPISSLFSTTRRPVIRPATTAASAWISPSHWAVADMPRTRPPPGRRRARPRTPRGPRGLQVPRQAHPFGDERRRTTDRIDQPALARVIHPLLRRG